MTRLFSILDAAIGAAVGRIILPVAGAVPLLVRTGLLFAGFAILWAVLIGALVLQPAALDGTWTWLTGLPLPVQAVAWLLFLPLAGALWVWSFDWPSIVRIVIVLGIGGWNLLVFRPQREGAVPASTTSPAPSAAAEA